MFTVAAGRRSQPLRPPPKVERWLTSGWTGRPATHSSWRNAMPPRLRHPRPRRDLCPRPVAAQPSSRPTTSQAVAVAALLDPAAHRNRAWTPTGPALTTDQVAADLSAALGRPIHYTTRGAALRVARRASTCRCNGGRVPPSTQSHGSAAPIDSPTTSAPSPVGHRRTSPRGRPLYRGLAMTGPDGQIGRRPCSPCATVVSAAVAT